MAPNVDVLFVACKPFSERFEWQRGDLSEGGQAPLAAGRCRELGAGDADGTEVGGGVRLPGGGGGSCGD
jgi:hypothetical protein